MTDYFIDSVVISVIIPFFNNHHTIEETLDSLESQQYKDFEVILVEDKNSKPFNLNISERYSFKFLYLKNKRNAGASSNRNLGMRNAKGKYLQFLDGDDIMSSDKFSSQIDLLKNKPFTVATCSWSTFQRFVGEDSVSASVLFRDYTSREYLMFLNGTFSEMMPVHCYLIPVAVINKTTGWDEQITLGDDGEFMNRVLVHANAVLFSKRGTAYYRRGDASSLSNTISEKAAYSNLLCSISYEELVKTYYPLDVKMQRSAIKKYNLLFLWAFNKHPEVASQAEKRVMALGGSLNMRIGSKTNQWLQFLLGIKVFLKLRYFLFNK